MCRKFYNNTLRSQDFLMMYGYILSPKSCNILVSSIKTRIYELMNNNAFTTMCVKSCLFKFQFICDISIHLQTFDTAVILFC